MTAPVEKTELRARMRALRRRLARQTPDAAERAARFAAAAGLPASGVIAAYRPQGAELDPWPAAKALAAPTSGVIALPVAASRDAPLMFRAWGAGQAEAPDAFGIAAPPADSPAVTPDLVIVPLLAFDRSGRRLGQGAGAYDRTIADLRASGRVFVLGLAYAGQEIGQVPAEPHDQGLDGVLTETGYIDLG